MTIVTLSNVQLQELYQRWWGGVQPWATVVDKKRYQLPTAPAPAGRRILRNLDKFLNNYSFIFAGLMIAAILLTPVLLLGIAVVLVAFYVVMHRSKEHKLSLYGHEVTTQHQYLAVAVLSIPFVWLLGAASTVMWVLGVSVIVALMHATLYNSDTDQDARADLLIEHV